jgi:hypothetical protein
MLVGISLQCKGQAYVQRKDTTGLGEANLPNKCECRCKCFRPMTEPIIYPPLTWGGPDYRIPAPERKWLNDSTLSIKKLMPGDGITLQLKGDSIMVTADTTALWTARRSYPDLDTVAVYILFHDIHHRYSVTDYQYSTAFWGYAYSVREKRYSTPPFVGEFIYEGKVIPNYHWEHLYYLDIDTRKPLGKNIIVWQDKEVK